MTDPAVDRRRASHLAGAVAAEEARQTEASATSSEQAVLPDDLLPGVGEGEMSLKEAVGAAGALPLVALGTARLVDGFDTTAMAVLAPDIQHSLGASDAVMGAIGAAFGVLFLLGAIPLSTLADRHPRKLVAAISVSIWGVVVLATSQVQSAFWLFVARLGAGISQSHTLPVNAPLLIDTYPIAARSRVFAAYGSFEVAGRVAGPLFAGGVAGAIAGPDSWRWVFALASLLSLPVVVMLLRMPEPRRGRNEMQSVLGAELDEDEGELPISLGVAFERLRKIRSFYFFLVGMAALGFALFSIPLFLNLYLEDQFGLSSWDRGVFAAACAMPSIFALAIVGRRADQLFRRNPAAAAGLVGALVAGFGVLVVIGLFMPSVLLLAVFYAAATALSQSAFITVISVISSVIPYRLRSRGTAMVGVYVFLFGGFFGAVLTGLLSDLIGLRAAMTSIVIPSTLVGGALIAYGGRFIRADLSRCVEELLEEKDEADRLTADDGDTPAIQVRNLDFSYGSVQILFDVSLDVARGETVALLGTNGAGKSTLLRVISGLGVPSRGVVRFDGRTITYCDPELRAKIGVVQLMGGNAVFGGLTVDENLRMAGYLYDRAELDERLASALVRFPALEGRRSAMARDLAGGQQQMLALAMALIHDPEVLIIDELSLGLAPIMVGELLKTVQDLKDQGLTMILVEQSLNVALAVADRAIFMEKGQIRFDGPAQELVERDDLARAVFLGAPRS